MFELSFAIRDPRELAEVVSTLGFTMSDKVANVLLKRKTKEAGEMWSMMCPHVGKHGPFDVNANNGHAHVWLSPFDGQVIVQVEFELYTYVDKTCVKLEEFGIKYTIN
jgi:hypothetical protein